MDYIRGIKIAVGVLVLILLSMAIFSWLPNRVNQLANEQGGWLQSIVSFIKGGKDDDPTAALNSAPAPAAVPVAPQTPGGNRSSNVQDDAPWLSEDYGE